MKLKTIECIKYLINLKKNVLPGFEPTTTKIDGPQPEKMPPSDIFFNIRETCLI